MAVLVIGGGIGGLSTALSLHDAGIDVELFEQAPEIQALGVGINLQPNAVRELIELGLAKALAAVAIETSELHYYNEFGQLIWAEPRGLAAGYRWPQYSIDRKDLHALLLDAVIDRIGADKVHADHALASFTQDEDSVTANFVSRATGEPQPPRRGSALIGADGIHSITRKQLYPNEGPPVSSGRIQWRGVIEAAPFLDGHTHVTLGHSQCRAVIYPMSQKSAEAGKSLINWVTVLGKQSASDAPGTWDRTAPKERFFEHFKNWNFDWIPFADLISETEEIYEYPKDDRDPLPRWSFERVTLLGDAAHPMRPLGSQAGSQGVVDARVLAKAFIASRKGRRPRAGSTSRSQVPLMRLSINPPTSAASTLGARTRWRACSHRNIIVLRRGSAIAVYSKMSMSPVTNLRFSSRSAGPGMSASASSVVMAFLSPSKSNSACIRLHSSMKTAELEIRSALSLRFSGASRCSAPAPSSTVATVQMSPTRSIGAIRSAHFWSASSSWILRCLPASSRTRS